MGLAHAAANRREEAVEAYEQSLQLRPDDIGTLAALAHASLVQGRYKEAEQRALRMVEIGPLISCSHLILGLAQLPLADYGDAGESFRRAASLEPGLAEASYGIGLVTVAVGHYDVADAEQKRLAEVDQKLGGKLNEMGKRGKFTQGEVVSSLFGEVSEDWKDEG